MTRTLTAVAVALGTLASVGCNESNKGGQVGTSNSFKLTGPTTSTSIRPDATETIKLGVDPGKDFKDTINLTVPDVPKGLSAELDKKTLEPGAKDFVLTVKAAKEAQAGDHVIKVSGTPKAGGQAVILDVKVTVKGPG